MLNAPLKRSTNWDMIVPFLGGLIDGWKTRETEDIVLKLRQVEVLQEQGKSVSEAVRQIGVTIQTYYRWRKEYGGMNRDQLKRLKELETENQRLKRVVADLSLNKMILTEAARGNY